VGRRYVLRHLGAREEGDAVVAQKGNPWALGCDDVAATRAELEAKGVRFAGDTFDTGVCHMAFFSDPDANDLMLHHRYAPYA
jgi:predicted enzyme related to lactoylglutathione lyase